MTATTDTEDAAGTGPDPVADAPHPVFVPEPGGTRVDVPLGRRIMVVSDLLLTAEATPSTLALTGELAQALDTWDGPGILVIAGNLFDLTECERPPRHGRSGHRRPPGAGPVLPPLPPGRRPPHPPPAGHP